MKVFVTGASGLVGRSVVSELLGKGHEVLALSRSAASAQKLCEAGTTPHPGDLSDILSLISGAQDADAVIHLGFIHDFSSYQKYLKANEVDYQAIRGMCDALVGTEKIFIGTNGTLLGSAFKPYHETDQSPPEAFSPRNKAEHLLLSYASRGVRPIVIRLPPITHGADDHGFTSSLIATATKAGYAAYLEEGTHIWPSVHVADAAGLYVSALEYALEHKPENGVAYHAVAENVEFKDIAKTIGDKLGVETRSLGKDQMGYFGFLEKFAGVDNPTSSEFTRKTLGWLPREIGVLEDLKTGTYFR